MNPSSILLQNINKMVLLSLFYAALFPFGLLLGAISLTIIYWVDKYSVLVSLFHNEKISRNF